MLSEVNPPQSFLAPLNVGLEEVLGETKVCFLQ